jgi:pimeloyl-ACP methyl ester carboxylesterase
VSAQAFLQNCSVRLHYVDSGDCREGRIPLLIVPGVTESAKDYESFIAQMPRRTIALTFRGRFPSDVPETGYALADHAADIAALVAALSLNRFAIYAFSRGVSYALAYAINHPNHLGALILGDYPPTHTQLPPDWVDRAWADTWRGRATSKRMPRSALEGLQREADPRSFVDDLKVLSCPVLIIAGNLERGSLLSEEDERCYARNLGNVTVQRRTRSGHDIRQPDESELMALISAFLRQQRIDRQDGS